ncbi:MAG TPA: efflux RND transporter permease subunit [Xanthobacteraceae bacterium]|nr:efflux RND transporter permease subunit [Xanthobacteraceae bacterium]
MALNVSAWSIRQPLPAIVFSIIVVALGALSFNRLPITRLPNVDLPNIAITVVQGGAAPAELEAQVTKIIEDAVSSVEGVKHIQSSITDSVSVTTVTFNLDVNTDRALNDIKDAVTRVRGELPRGIEEPLVRRIDITGLPIVTYAAISPGKTPEQLSWFVDDVVERELQGVRGVGRVERIGGVERQILVSLNPDRLQALGLTAADVSRRLHANDVDLAGGRAEVGGRDEAIRTIAGARTLDALAATVIALPNGGQVRLDDLGVVTDTIADPRTFARLDGEPVVAFGIVRTKGASDVTVAAAVEESIKKITADHPEYEIKLIDSSVKHTLGNYENAIHTLFEGAALAVIAVLIFLRDLRATVIAAVTLPLSIFPAFWAMDALGFSLNLVSLLAITLSTGIIVDDAIVEIENIVRHIRMGKSAYQAAIDAADEIGLAVIAISLTIIAVFAPASFMGSVAGQFFKQFGITVSVQILFSLLAARLVTPMLAAYFMRAHAGAEERHGKLMATYARLVDLSVRRRYLTLLLGLALLAVSIWSATLLPRDFLPKQDTARSVLAIELPSGSQRKETEEKTEAIVKRLRTRPEVQSVFVDGGRIPPTPAEPRKATLVINYTPKADRKLSQAELEQAIGRDLANVPDIRYWFLDDNGQRAISIVITGADNVKVASVAAELANKMRQSALMTNVVSTAALDHPELRIIPRKDLAARAGVSTEALADAIRVATIGDVSPNLAKFDAGDRVIPIRVQIEDSGRADRQVLEQLRVPTLRGATVPLLAVAEIQLGQGPISINRFDRQRQATVEADLVGAAALDEALAAIDSMPVMKNLPAGIHRNKSGAAEAMDDLFGGFSEAMRNGLMMVFAVLVLLFGSFLQPITILFSLPLSIGGAIGALFLTGRPISMPVIIGILMLMGIVTKNAIMLVDFAIESIAHGVERTQAIVDAGTKRARPIIMTTFAMVAGMAPAAIGVGAGGEFRSPMAIAVIGGLIVSTFLSLLFVPAFFAVMDDVGKSIWRLFSRFIMAGDEPEKAHEPPAAATP